MFDLGTLGEVFIIAVAALILIGPKEMPTVLRTLGRWTQKLKFLSSTLRHEVTRHLQDGELEEYTRRINEGILSRSNNDSESQPEPQRPPRSKSKPKSPKKRSTQETHKHDS